MWRSSVACYFCSRYSELVACLGVSWGGFRRRCGEHRFPLSHQQGVARGNVQTASAKGQPLAAKIIVLLLLGFVGVITFIPLDLFRFHLMAKPATLVASFGLVLFVTGWSMMTLALKENAFAAPVVKYQKERQQKVIVRGVYGVVRHPMYAGAVLLLSAFRYG